MKLTRRFVRIGAGVFFLLAAAGPVSAWAIYLFYLQPSEWQQSLKMALLEQSPYRGFLWLLVIAALYNLAAIGVVLTTRNRAVLVALIVGSAALSLGFMTLKAWTLALGAALPLWWLYQALHEV